jgi:hypothetical protein
MPNSQNKTPLPKPIASSSFVPIWRFNSVGVKKFPRIVRRQRQRVLEGEAQARGRSALTGGVIEG